MQWTFVLKDKGTKEQGWWLKISSFDELLEYLRETNPTRFGKVFENYMYGKDGINTSTIRNEFHGPHPEEASTTQACTMYAAKNHMTILEGIQGFEAMIATRQLEKIETYGAIFINPVGGYHADYDGPHTYDFIRRDKLVFPDFTKADIRVKQFPHGEHFYAYIGDTQVRDGDTLKWSTYDEAYKQAEKYI